jgi:hypothetical protein
MSKSAHRTATNFAMDSVMAGASTLMTLSFRLPMFAWTSLVPFAQRQAEMVRMVDEKAAAMVEGAVLANIELVRLAGVAASGRMRPDEVASAAVGLAAAGMRPAYKTVRANARRLHRQSLRG